MQDSRLWRKGVRKRHNLKKKNGLRFWVEERGEQVAEKEEEVVEVRQAQAVANEEHHSF